MGIKTKIIGILSVLLLVGSLVFWGHWERKGRQKAEKEAETAQDRLEASESARWKEHASSMRVYFNEQARLQELQNEKADLARRLADDAIGLRVNATCPGSDENPTPGGQSDAAAPQLTDSARRAYRSLREGIIEQRSQIEGLQRYIREECLDKKEPSEEG